jgi:hypothetical protein
MDTCYIISLIIVILLIIFYFINTSEYFATDIEAIANIASIYNTAQMKLTNLDVAQNLNTGTLNAGTLNATTLTAGTFNLIPKGIISLWSGQIANIPAGWILCDGGNGTPDLRSRFIVGAGSDYTVGTIGGANSITLTAAQMPAHTHGLHTNNACFHNGGCDTRNTLDNSQGVNWNTESAGGNQPFDNRPPYYALAYIMKT